MTNRAGRGAGYSAAELDDLLGQIETIRPISQNEWERIHEEHERSFPGRDVASLRRKFRSLYSVRIPTGDPTCPPNVRRAKLALREINTRADIGDNTDYDLEIAAFGEDVDDNVDDNVDDDVVAMNENPDPAPPMIDRGNGDNNAIGGGGNAVRAVAVGDAINANGSANTNGRRSTSANTRSTSNAARRATNTGSATVGQSSSVSPALSKYPPIRVPRANSNNSKKDDTSTDGLVEIMKLNILSRMGESNNAPATTNTSNDLLQLAMVSMLSNNSPQAASSIPYPYPPLPSPFMFHGHTAPPTGYGSPSITQYGVSHGHSLGPFGGYHDGSPSISYGLTNPEGSEPSAHFGFLSYESTSV